MRYGFLLRLTGSHAGRSSVIANGQDSRRSIPSELAGITASTMCWKCFFMKSGMFTEVPFTLVTRTVQECLRVIPCHNFRGSDVLCPSFTPSEGLEIIRYSLMLRTSYISWVPSLRETSLWRNYKESGCWPPPCESWVRRGSRCESIWTLVLPQTYLLRGKKGFIYIYIYKTLSIKRNWVNSLLFSPD